MLAKNRIQTDKRAGVGTRQATEESAGGGIVQLRSSLVLCRGLRRLQLRQQFGVLGGGLEWIDLLIELVEDGDRDELVLGIGRKGGGHFGGGSAAGKG